MHIYTPPSPLTPPVTPKRRTWRYNWPCRCAILRGTHAARKFADIRPHRGDLLLHTDIPLLRGVPKARLRTERAVLGRCIGVYEYIC
jgi:hypothetical protein